MNMEIRYDNSDQNLRNRSHPPRRVTTGERSIDEMNAGHAKENEAVTKDVQILAEDPYTKGWLVKVKVADASPVAGLLDHKAYQAKVADEAH